MKKFTSIHDVDHLRQWVDLALQIKRDPKQFRTIGQDKVLGLLFFNPSLRTRLSTQKAAYHLGMQVMVMNLNQDGWRIELGDGTIMDQGTQEHIKEAAGVVSQYCDIIGLRTFASLTDRQVDYADTILHKFIQHAHVPVISLESAIRHPLQSFADLLTIEEHKNTSKPKVVLSWAPHPRALPQAVANSFIEWMRATEVDLCITHPQGFALAPEFTEGLPIYTDQATAFEDADFVYAKNWSAYDDYGAIGQGLDDWQITSAKMALTRQGKFMHCLPVRRNVVAADAVLDADTSLVLAQACNRTYAAQTVLLKMLQDEA